MARGWSPLLSLKGSFQWAGRLFRLPLFFILMLEEMEMPATVKLTIWR